LIPEPSGAIALADGRQLAYDDVGARDGLPVLYLHGCPDCRLARPPDDRVAGAAGVRLVALDRPGYGASDADPSGNEATQADDVVALADALGLEKFAVLGWSAGGPAALAVAALHSARVLAVGVAAGMVPIDADADPAVFAAVDPVITTRGEVMETMTPADFASAIAPLVAPEGASLDLAREMVVEGKDAAYLADLESVDGLLERLALVSVAATARGLAGVEMDMRSMVTPWPFDLGAIRAPTVLWYGTEDQRFRPPAGQWLADRIRGARLLTVAGASHLLPLARWRDVLADLVSLVPASLAQESTHASQP
jgi:pimeloyl-ACP methyl ester carboxylesterase